MNNNEKKSIESKSGTMDVKNFLKDYSSFALQNWMEQRNKNKKKNKSNKGNFIKNSLQQFAKTYPNAPEEAQKKTGKWLINQLSHPAQAVLVMEFAALANGLFRRVRKTRKKGKQLRVQKIFKPADLLPFIDLAAELYDAKNNTGAGKVKKEKKKKKDKNKEKSGNKQKLGNQENDANAIPFPRSTASQQEKGVSQKPFKETTSNFSDQEKRNF